MDKTKVKLTEVEQNLLDELNHKARQIIKLENLLAKKKVPVNEKALYSLTIEQIGSLLEIWSKPS